MKKLILIAIIGLVSFSAFSQNLNKENILLYADTTVLSGNDTLIRNLYAFLPVYRPIDSVYYFPMRRIYYLNGTLITNKKEAFGAHYDETIEIGGTLYTYEEVYNLIIDINATPWNLAFWQIFQQKINNQ